MKTIVISVVKMLAIVSICLVRRLDSQDIQFVIWASQANLAQTEFGQLAETRSGTDSIKLMAGQMVKDYQLAEKDLVILSKQLNLQLPMRMDSDHIVHLATIQKLTGKSFDAFYLNAENLDHQQIVSLFKIEILQGSDSSIKDYAKKYLPTLENHLKMFHNATTELMRSGNSAFVH